MSPNPEPQINWEIVLIRKLLFVVFAILVGLAALGAALGPQEGDKIRLERIGYFKDDDRSRVMAFRTPRALNRVEAEEALASVMHSAGANTWAVVYGPEALAPGDELTILPRRAKAVEMIMTPPFHGWDWYLAIRHDGQRILKAR